MVKLQPEDTSPQRGALALATMPFTFTQDDLLDSRGFARAAKDRGFNINVDGLQSLHRQGLLVPLYRVSDVEDDGRRLDVAPNGSLDQRWQMLVAAREGRLHDAGAEEYLEAWSYRRPANEQDRRWWNGFLFSSWQLLDIEIALQEYEGVQRGLDRAVRAELIAERQHRTHALAALAPRYLPGIVGHLRLPSGIDEERLGRFRFDSDLRQLLAAVGFAPDKLRLTAEQMLFHAKNDPLQGWLPLVRHASYKAWEKLRGEPLHCMWLRIGAEVLLRAHEELAELSVLEPLPDVTRQAWWTPLHDRLHRSDEATPSLESALGAFGLSPHPRVVLVVEGETERQHFGRLLDLFGLNRPELVRVQHTKGSRVNPQLLARYAISPRLGTEYDDGWEFDATPTAVVIVMDPENLYATPQERAKLGAAVKGAIREEIELQGAAIANDDLDFMVTVRVWGDQKYELANFTDVELVPALVAVARRQGVSGAGSAEWETELRSRLLAARTSSPPKDIKVIAGPMRMREDKVALAAELWPVLQAKCQQELEQNDVVTPVVDVMLEVERLVGQLSAGTFVLRRPAPASDGQT